jgi:hypothetical protein
MGIWGLPWCLNKRPLNRKKRLTTFLSCVSCILTQVVKNKTTVERFSFDASLSTCVISVANPAQIT